MARYFCIRCGYGSEDPVLWLDALQDKVLKVCFNGCCNEHAKPLEVYTLVQLKHLEAA